MNQEAKVAEMSPGSKVRTERWAPLRFRVKVVELPQSKLPKLITNFGTMPRVSIAEHVNKYSRSVAQINAETDMRAVLKELIRVIDAKQKYSYRSIAREVGWKDYRKAQNILIEMVKQKLTEYDEESKSYRITEAGHRFASESGLEEITGGDDPLDSDDTSAHNEVAALSKDESNEREETENQT